MKTRNSAPPHYSSECFCAPIASLANCTVTPPKLLERWFSPNTFGRLFAIGLASLLSVPLLGFGAAYSRTPNDSPVHKHQPAEPTASSSPAPAKRASESSQGNEARRAKQDAISNRSGEGNQQHSVDNAAVLPKKRMLPPQFEAVLRKPRARKVPPGTTSPRPGPPLKIANREKTFLGSRW